MIRFQTTAVATALLLAATSFSDASYGESKASQTPVGCEQTSEADHVMEVTVFRVTDAEAGVTAANAIAGDAQAYNNAIISHTVKADLVDPTVLVQQITWCSLDAAKDAFAHSEGFPNMATMMSLMTESLYFGYVKP